MTAESRRNLAAVLCILVAGCLESNPQPSPESSRAAEDVLAHAPDVMRGWGEDAACGDVLSPPTSDVVSEEAGDSIEDAIDAIEDTVDACDLEIPPVAYGVSDAGESETADAGEPTAQGLVVCDGVELPCDFDNPGLSPWPYDECSGNPFYHVCPDESCVPADPELQTFYAAWKKEAPALLKMSQEQFEQHVFVNNVEEHPLSEEKTYRLFRVNFLVVFDWAVLRENHSAKVWDGKAVTEATIIEELGSHDYNIYNGLPDSVISLDDVLALFGACHPDMKGDFCHIYWHKKKDKNTLKFTLWGTAPVDWLNNVCQTMKLILETGEGTCQEDVCYMN